MEYIIGALKFLAVLAIFLFTTYLWMRMADFLGRLIGLNRLITWVLEKLRKDPS